MPVSPPLNIVFAGTPEFAAVHLRGLLASQHKIVGVYTQPDRPAGRGKQLQVGAVKRVALDADLATFQPQNLKTAEAQAELAKLAPDIMVVVAYGLLLPPLVLTTPALGCINVHASLLPRWRGAAPIQRAIEAGDEQTGITIMQMDAGLDTGAMLAKTCCAILPADTAQNLHDRLAVQGVPALLEVLAKLAAGPLPGETQDARLATYAHKLSKEEAALDWRQDAEHLARQVRAFNPAPMAYTEIAGGRMRVLAARAGVATKVVAPGTLLHVGQDGLRVACGVGELMITDVQFAGKNPMAVKAILNGQHPFIVGMVFGQ